MCGEILLLPLTPYFFISKIVLMINPKKVKLQNKLLKIVKYNKFVFLNIPLKKPKS